MEVTRKIKQIEIATFQPVRVARSKQNSPSRNSNRQKMPKSKGLTNEPLQRRFGFGISRSERMVATEPIKKQMIAMCSRESSFSLKME